MSANALEYIKTYAQMKRNFVGSLPKDGLTEALRSIYEGQIMAYNSVLSEIFTIETMLPTQIKPPPPPVSS